METYRKAEENEVFEFNTESYYNADGKKRKRKKKKNKT